LNPARKSLAIEQYPTVHFLPFLTTQTESFMLGIFIDIETTGLNPYKHRTLEVALRVKNLSNNTSLNSFSCIVSQPENTWKESDPESLAVNGFTWDQCQQGLPEYQVSEEIEYFLTNIGIKRGEAVFIAQNSSFDRAFFAQLITTYRQEKLNWPYHWIDLASMYWSFALRNSSSSAKTIETIPLSKNAIAKQLGLPKEESPHRAMNGVNHLIECYEKLFYQKN
jgi:DNA polymerase-3 subunit epsilon/oligoribonuclease